jgi:hypothetical protein
MNIGGFRNSAGTLLVVHLADVCEVLGSDPCTQAVLILFLSVAVIRLKQTSFFKYQKGDLLFS